MYSIRCDGNAQKNILICIIISPKFAKAIFTNFINVIKEAEIMAKGPEKNTKNKALHTKLLNRKKAKLQAEKKESALRLKALVAKMNAKKNTDGSDII
ncbi:hypothetical protein [Flavobacterium sp. JAS]|uniref:hypothetical protein n=1 Tax=Flavobacterium sp. JAS TaxID=2897329 RepID=UPI001E406FDB|nr:hypothetical protein [Flavobacterium sp. JAS]MCD0469993.1 hypothetical protein [Flavobacterium sp. JAS]